MSHYVYLDACPFPRMPDGAAGEWRAFWAGHRPELEAKNGPPLLWWCLFGAGDLKRARLADEADTDADDREAGSIPAGGLEAEATYSYLVTDRDIALRRLAQRRGAVLEAVGERYAALYDGFVALIARDFGPFVLLRTSGLPDAEGMEPWLREMADEMDALDAGAAAGPLLVAMAADFRRWEDEDPLWLLSGAGQPGTWPTPALAAAYPARRVTGNAPGSGAPAGPGGSPVTRARQRLDGVLEWLAALATGGAGVAALWLTSSILYGGIAFVACAGLTVWLLLRRG